MLRILMTLTLLVLCGDVHGQLIVETIAGGGSVDNTAATEAALGSFGFAGIGPDGAIYLSCEAQLKVITPAGIVRAVAGTGVPGFSGDGGPAAKAQIYGGPLAVDSAGNLYLGDRNRIRMITADGVIRTIAGNGYPVTGTDTGPALSTNVGPWAIAADSQGNVFFTNFIASDNGKQHSVLRLAKEGVITAYSGLFTGYARNGDGGPATAADIYPLNLTVDRQGRLLISEPGDVRRIETDGVIGTILSCENGAPVSGNHGLGSCSTVLSRIAVGPAGALYVSGAPFVTAPIWKVEGGATTTVRPDGTLGAVDASGSIYFTQSFFPSRLFRLDPAGNQTTVAGTGTFTSPDGSPAQGAILNLGSAAIAIGSQDRLLFAEIGTCRIRSVDTTGKLGTLAGTGNCATTANAGPIAKTDLCFAASITASASGLVFVACTDGSLARIDPAGQVAGIVRTAGEYCEQILADAKENLYCLHSGLTRIAPDGTSTPILFPRGSGGLVDAMAFGPDGTLYVTAYSSGSDQVFTLAGSSLTLKTGLDLPFGQNLPCLVVDAANRFIQCNGHQLFVSSGTRTAKLGLLGGYGFGGDGGPLQSAKVGFPVSLTQDSKGRLYFADRNYEAIRRISGTLPASTPRISPNGIVNAASYAGAGLSSGELIAIFGQNLSYDSAVFKLDDVQVYPALSSTKVVVNRSEATVISVSPGQVNAIVPFLGTGSFAMSVTVEVDGIASNTITMPNAAAVPGIFTASGTGSGQGSIVNQDGSINSSSAPAPAGSIVSVYGTGGGDVSAQLFNGYLALASDPVLLRAGVGATVSGAKAEVLYAGAAPFLVSGVNQFNIRLPANAASGPADLMITIAGQASNRVIVQVR